MPNNSKDKPTSKKDEAKPATTNSNVSNKTSKDTEKESEVVTPAKKSSPTDNVIAQQEKVPQGTEGERDAPSHPDPEIKRVSREDQSLIKDLHDNTKEQERYEQKPAAEIAEIKTKVDADLAKNEVVSEGSAPERDDANTKIITQEIDGKEQVFEVQNKEQYDANERRAQVAVNNSNEAAAAEPTPIEKTIQKLNENVPEPNAIDPKDKEAKQDEKIVKFLKGKSTGEYTKLNDFLKSIYPAKKGNEPAVWDNQGESKRLRVLLDTMQSHGMIEIQNNRHSQLGTTFYTGAEQYSKVHTLATLDIYAKAK